jgi:acetolactate synthase-1/2/3 large subunit
MTETIAVETLQDSATGATRASVAEAMAAELRTLGVDRVFGVPGGEVLFLIDALRREGIEFAVCRHEADAGLAAAVYGKLKRTTGVVLTTLGPGAANLMLPLANSWLDREPLLAISAATPAAWSFDRTHQKLPLLETYGSVTKLADAVTPFNCRGLLRRAVAATLAEPAGPALLTLSADHAVLAAEDTVGEPSDTSSRLLSASAAVDAAHRLYRLLAAAERPVVLLGLGVRAENVDALRGWLDRWQLPVGVTPKVKGIVDENAPNFIGTVGGMAIDSAVREALSHADLIVGFGLDPSEIDGSWHTELPIVWALESPWATGMVPTRGLLAAVHADLLRELGGEAPRAWDDPFETLRHSRIETFERDGADKANLTPVAVVRTLAKVFPPETILVTDVGSHKYVFGQFWPSRQPETFFMSNGLSGMGYGLPAAIGAKLARPEAPVLAVLGDGGFSMNSQELETAKRLGAPFVTVVLADRSYSLIRIGQENRGLTRYGVDFDPIDSVLTAQACGIDAVRATTAAELEAAVAPAIGTRTPLLVEIPIDADDYRGIV